MVTRIVMVIIMKEKLTGKAVLNATQFLPVKPLKKSLKMVL
ncbi:hypothetical protein [Barnesiella intestinihominis]|nr:hypothetical protein [Barnesiella intestinihominis]MDB0676046.1 hypothetical protein [Barnesiella intestinihominis]